MSEWISVKDRLPEPGQLCKVKYQDWRYGAIFDEGEDSQKHEGRGRFEATMGEELGECYRSVTHWIPLAEPQSA